MEAVVTSARRLQTIEGTGWQEVEPGVRRGRTKSQVWLIIVNFGVRDSSAAFGMTRLRSE